MGSMSNDDQHATFWFSCQVGPDGEQVVFRFTGVGLHIFLYRVLAECVGRTDDAADDGTPMAAAHDAAQTAVVALIHGGDTAPALHFLNEHGAEVLGEEVLALAQAFCCGMARVQAVMLTTPQGVDERRTWLTGLLGAIKNRAGRSEQLDETTRVRVTDFADHVFARIDSLDGSDIEAVLHDPTIACGVGLLDRDDLAFVDELRDDLDGGNDDTDPRDR